MDERVRRIIAEQLAVDLEQVVDTALFSRDLGADSLDMVELAMRFEQAFDVALDEDETEACLSVGAALDLLRMQLPHLS